MPLLLLLLLLLLPPSPSNAHSSFSLDFFPGDGAIAQLALSAANATSTGAISMRPPRARVQYRKPITFDAGFSTYFSFSLHPNTTTNHNHPPSLSFFLTPPTATHPNDHILAVVFAAEADPTRTRTRIRIRIRIDLAGVQTAPIPFSRTQKLHSWIDYNATSATLQVRLSASRLPKPLHPHLSYSFPGPLHLSALLAGFASSHANCTLFSWAFKANHGPPYLMHSLPLDPTALLTTPPPDRPHRVIAPVRPPPYHYPWVLLLFAAACGTMLTFFLLFAWYSVGARRPVAPVEYPMHPSNIVYEKIVLVGVKDLPTHVAVAGNK